MITGFWARPQYKLEAVTLGPLIHFLMVVDYHEDIFVAGFVFLHFRVAATNPIKLQGMCAEANMHSVHSEVRKHYCSHVSSNKSSTAILSHSRIILCH